MTIYIYNFKKYRTSSLVHLVNENSHPWQFDMQIQQSLRVIQCFNITQKYTRIYNTCTKICVTKVNNCCNVSHFISSSNLTVAAEWKTTETSLMTLSSSFWLTPRFSWRISPVTGITFLLKSGSCLFSFSNSY